MSRSVFALFSLVLLAGNAISHQRSVVLRGIPHVKQKPDFCGEACAEMALRRLGHRINQDDVFNQTGLDPALGRGAYTAELARGLNKLGLEVGQVWYKIRPSHAAQAIQQQFRAMHADLQAGHPSIVCTRYDTRPNTTEHFRLIVGYDSQRDEVIYHEPASSRGAYRRMPRRMLLKLWPLKYRRDQWTIVRIRLKPRQIRQPRREANLARYAQHVRRLRSTLPSGFSIVVQPPFVVIGDEDRAMVQRRARQTVKWAVDQLKRAYFTRDPNKIINVWLFKDASSYERHALQLFGDRPSTPYGYYSHQHNALVMNISTGGGTLVHEIVHPFIESNFPSCPSWFNEGLGSLYEQSGSCDGKICGLTNWRLAGLQRAIRAHRVPSFRYLTSRTTVQFYDQDPGTNYAQSRYLLYYLQQKKLLRTYYKAFYRNRRHDPTGYRTLQRILGASDMTAFKRRWESFVLRLRY